MIDSPHKDYALAPSASGPGSWLETFGLTGLAIGLGLWLTPEDPLQVYSFPWPLLAPILVGLRYGFVKALVSAAILVGMLLVLRAQGEAAYATLPATYVIGMLVTAMLVGEFRDLWDRRLQRLQMANEYRQYRLDEFTRAHQILRISHDRLEQRVAGSDQSLRSSLLLLREQMQQLREQGDALGPLAQPILGLLGQYGSIRVAGLYAVDAQMRLEPAPLATLGEMGDLEPQDALVRLCLEKGDLVSVREEFLERGEERGFSTLQACVPLIDSNDSIRGVVAIRQMPFFAFNDRTLSLLALLAGHVADLLQSDSSALKLEDADAQRFFQHLRRSQRDVEHHGLTGSLFALELAEPNEEMLRLITDSQRGLDLQLRLRNRRDQDCVLVLMPLTSAQGAQGYLKRLQYMLHERFGQSSSLEAFGVTVRAYELDPAGQRGLSNFLLNECALHDDQVAV